MKTHSLLAFAIIAALLSGGLNAQEKKKFYRWVDKNGKVQISDQLPPEAVNQARTEINAKGSSTISGQVDRALTAEERAAQALQASTDAEAKKNADQLKRVEDAMLINYATEDDLLRTYKERIDLLQQTIESTDISVKSIHSSLTGMLLEASESELAKRPVEPARSKQIQDMHNELIKQQAAQISSHADVKIMENERAVVLARYRELRGTGTSPSAVPARAPVAPVVQTPATPSN